jgi:hypothetical protein
MVNCFKRYAATYVPDIDKVNIDNLFGKRLYEEFNSDKTYNTDYFEHDLGYGVKKYYYSMFAINDEYNREKKYVLYSEKITATDLDTMVNFCQCYYHLTYHNKPWYYFGKYFCSRSKHGCLDTPFAGDDVIIKTREYIAKNNNKLPLDNEKINEEN